MPAARTKIRPPRAAPGTLARLPLRQRMTDAVARHAMLLLRAPAGYGKTTVLADLTVSLSATQATAWVSVEPRDSLATFVEALLAALDPLDPNWPASERALVAAAGQPDAAQSLAMSISEGLSASDSGRGLIVVDDLHTSTDATLGAFVAALLDCLPMGWHLALGTRSEPFGDLLRRRLQGQVCELGPDDLAFDLSDVEHLARALDVPRTELRPLHERAAGWPAGVRLALLAGGSSAPIDAEVFDYLSVEVIDRLPADLREFLVHSAVLPELTAAAAAAVTGDARAGEQLVRLRQLGLFATEVDELGSLRLHELFRSALLRRLHRHEPERVPQLLRRAAAAESDGLRRVEWLQAAGDEDAAARALLQAGAGLIADGKGAPVRQLLLQFTPKRRAADPALAIVQAQLAWSVWDFRTMHQALMRCDAAAAGEWRELLLAYRVCACDGLMLGAERDRAIAELGDGPLQPLPRLLLLSCRPHAPADASALPGVTADLLELMMTAERIGTADAWLQATPLPMLALLPGARPALQHYVRATGELCAAQPNALRMWSLVMDGWLKIGQGQWRLAARTFERAEADGRWEHAAAGGLAHVHAGRAMAEALCGDASASQRHRQRQAELLQESASSSPELAAYVRDLLAVVELRCRVWLGDADGLRRACRQTPSAASDPCGLQPMLAFARGVLDALGARDAAAAERWRALLPGLTRLEGQGLPSELRLRLAAAEAASGHADRARTLLAEVCDQLQPGFEDGPACMAGVPTLERLAACAGRHDFPLPLQERLAAWRARAAQAHLDEPAAAQGTPQLTGREEQILARLARGDSNKHIALAFDLSAHTVKRHVANILGKLALRTRGQAAAWWRDRPLGAQRRSGGATLPP